MEELSKQYNPKEVEDTWYRFWEAKELFSARPNPKKKPFCIVIPPPNVTGILHMGHALNNTFQDILIRYHRMKDEEALWMPGTDHAGIATQNVVERQLSKEGLKRQDLEREKFLERVWQWRQQYGATIINQLKKLGSSCDWSRTRFTMDEGYSRAVMEVFVRLYEKGLIYRGNYIINWCPRCQTALSDEEAPHAELDGSLYYLKYPFKDNEKEFIVVATTRPETMLADTAVAVNPKDKRYKDAIGKSLILPLIKRQIKVIADPMVDMKFGTGAVKVTPAHDPNDYMLGKKHNLEFINIMHPEAILNAQAGRYQGLERFKAREVILEDLRKEGLLEKIEPYKVSAGHCYRCHTIIEPYLSNQWFVSMKPLAKPAIEVVKKGKVTFYPARWKKVYLNWVENIGDWCISRQIWWGHRIPVYYCKKCQETGKSPASPAGRQIPNPKSQINYKFQNSKQAYGVIVSRTKPQSCPHCGGTDIVQDEDVLDTWFSSWLWPFATFGWPFIGHKSQVTSHKQNEKDLGHETCDMRQRDLAYFYPTSVLVTAPEIIFFWVARMIMAGLEFMKGIPFKDVYIHGTVRDIEGKKMSKSLGNVIDPLEVIDEFGADALRFSLVSITATGQDVFLSREKFQMGRNFANKIWNASRFILMNIQDSKLPSFRKEDLNVQERWIMSRLQATISTVSEGLAAYRFNESAKRLYEFFWHEFCDWFIEMSKDDCSKGRDISKAVLVSCLRDFLKLLHPFMPFISEEVWSRLPGNSISIMRQQYPKVQKQFIDAKIESRMSNFISLVSRVRNLRADLNIEPSKFIDCLIDIPDKDDLKFLKELTPQLQQLTKSGSVALSQKAQKLDKAFSDVESGSTIYISLAGVVDILAQSQRLEKRASQLEAIIDNCNRQLHNKEFLNKAPAEVIAGLKEKFKSDQASLQKVRKIYDALKKA
jgi:valyl-tRNA synthetase